MYIVAVTWKIYYVNIININIITSAIFVGGTVFTLNCLIISTVAKKIICGFKKWYLCNTG